MTDKLKITKKDTNRIKRLYMTILNGNPDSDPTFKDSNGIKRLKQVTGADDRYISAKLLLGSAVGTYPLPFKYCIA